MVEVYRFELCVHALSSSPDVHNMWHLSGCKDLFWKELHKGWSWSLDNVLIFIIRESERNQMSVSVLSINISIAIPTLFLNGSFFESLHYLSVFLISSKPKKGFLSFSPVVLHLAICKNNLWIFLLFIFICFLQVWASTLKKLLQKLPAELKSSSVHWITSSESSLVPTRT